MFDYKFVINIEKMEVSIVPFKSKDFDSGYVSSDPEQERWISYPNRKYPDDRYEQPLFFHIESKLFPSYLRCENFPWERLENLQEALNFKRMYDSYNQASKTVLHQFYFDASDPFGGIRANKDDVFVGKSFISCSCECSEDFKIEFANQKV